MEFYIDTVDLAEIQEAVKYLPVAGVTSNPSIVKKSHPKHFFSHMRQIRDIIGKDRPLHIQVTARYAEQMVSEAYKIFEEIDDQVYIKIPATYEGTRAIRILKKEGHHVTATAVYDLMQAYMALEAGADFIAPYVNRINNLGGDPYALIEKLSERIEKDGYSCKILAASFQGVGQVRQALNAGAKTVTAPVEIYRQIFANPSIAKAVNDFNADWYSMYQDGCSLLELQD